MAFYLYWEKWIEEDNFNKLLAELNTVYSVHLGTILAFYFAGLQRRRDIASDTTAFTIAALCSLVWNALIIILILRVVLLIGSVEAAVRQIKTISAVTAWMVAPALGFYYARSADHGGGK